MDPVLQFLRDQVWQFVGAFLALVAIVLTVVLFLKQRQRKALTWEIVSAVHVLSVSDEVKGRVQILFDGDPITDVKLIVIQITNSGQQPVVPGDYERPIAFAFGDDARILSAEVVETGPKELHVELAPDDNTITIEPVLLNGGDWVIWKALVTPAKARVKASARVVGVRRFESRELVRSRWYPPSILGTVGTMAVGMIGAVFTKSPVSSLFGLVFILAAITLFVLAGTDTARAYRAYRRYDPEVTKADPRA